MRWSPLSIRTLWGLGLGTVILMLLVLFLAFGTQDLKIPGTLEPLEHQLFQVPTGGRVHISLFYRTGPVQEGDVLYEGGEDLLNEEFNRFKLELRGLEEQIFGIDKLTVLANRKQGIEVAMGDWEWTKIQAQVQRGEESPQRLGLQKQIQIQTELDYQWEQENRKLKKTELLHRKSSLELEIQVLEKRKDEARIIAPWAGWIIPYHQTSKEEFLGTAVRPGMHLTQGTPLGWLVKDDVPRIRLHIPENMVGELRPNMRVQVQLVTLRDTYPLGFEGVLETWESNSRGGLVTGWVRIDQETLGILGEIFKGALWGSKAEVVLPLRAPWETWK